MQLSGIRNTLAVTAFGAASFLGAQPAQATIYHVNTTPLIDDSNWALVNPSQALTAPTSLTSPVAGDVSIGGKLISTANTNFSPSNFYSMTPVSTNQPVYLSFLAFIPSGQPLASSRAVFDSTDIGNPLSNTFMALSPGVVSTGGNWGNNQRTDPRIVPDTVYQISMTINNSTGEMTRSIIAPTWSVVDTFFIPANSFDASFTTLRFAGQRGGEGDRFIMTNIPTPGTAALLVAGGLLAARRRR